MRFLISTLTLLLFLTLLGCGDEVVTPKPKPFSFTIAVKAPDGTPVEGLEATLHVPVTPNEEGFEPKPGATTSLLTQTSLDYTQCEAGRTQLRLYDVEDTLVRTLVDQQQPDGIYRIAYDGRDNLGNDLVGTVVLRYELTVQAIESDSLLFSDSKYMVIYTGIDALQRPLLGQTDASGQLRVTDKTLFPCILSLPDLPSTTYEGATGENITLHRKIYLTLRDPSNEQTQEEVFQITPEENTFSIEWVGQMASAASAARPHAPHAGNNEQLAPGTERLDDPVPVPDPEPICEWSLGQNYPNPFN